jgi:DNA-binding LacI/PurR family transcriptional regulator
MLSDVVASPHGVRPSHVLTLIDRRIRAGKPVMSVKEPPLVSRRTQVIRRITRLLNAGQARAGEQVPSERALAEQLGVGRGIVRGALADLVRDGVLRESDGRGLCFASRHRTSLMAGTVVVLTTLPEARRLHKPFDFGEQIALGAVEAARRAGRHVMMMDPLRLEASQVQHLLADPPAGVACPEVGAMPELPVDVLHSFREAGIPVVVYGGSTQLATFDRVRSDHRWGCHEITRRLLACGRSRIACYWSTVAGEPYWVTDRRAGYEQAMRDAGLEPLPVHHTFSALCDPSPGQSPAEAFELRVRCHMGYLHPLLRSPNSADALVLLTDGIVPEVNVALRNLGCDPRVGPLVAGYDNYYAHIESRAFDAAPPSLTADKRDLAAGAEMIALLEDRIARRLPDEPQERLVRPDVLQPAGELPRPG